MDQLEFLREFWGKAKKFIWILEVNAKIFMQVLGADLSPAGQLPPYPSVWVCPRGSFPRAHDEKRLFWPKDQHQHPQK